MTEIVDDTPDDEGRKTERPHYIAMFAAWTARHAERKRIDAERDAIINANWRARKKAASAARRREYKRDAARAARGQSADSVRHYDASRRDLTPEERRAHDLAKRAASTKARRAAKRIAAKCLENPLFGKFG